MSSNGNTYTKLKSGRTPKMRTYGIYSQSHWQGAGPARLIATGSEAACKAMERALSTCSFCQPGRTGGYSVGSCYIAQRTGYARASARSLPDEAKDWTGSDFREWLDDDDDMEI